MTTLKISKGRSLMKRERSSEGNSSNNISQSYTSTNKRTKKLPTTNTTTTTTTTTTTRPNRYNDVASVIDITTERAVLHRASEQRRRNKVSTNFNRLKDIIPACIDRQGKVDKATLLAMAIDYIVELQKKVVDAGVVTDSYSSMVMDNNNSNSTIATSTTRTVPSITSTAATSQLVLPPDTESESTTILSSSTSSPSSSKSSTTTTTSTTKNFIDSLSDSSIDVDLTFDQITTSPLSPSQQQREAPPPPSSSSNCLDTSSSSSSSISSSSSSWMLSPGTSSNGSSTIFSLERCDTNEMINNLFLSTSHSLEDLIQYDNLDLLLGNNMMPIATTTTGTTTGTTTSNTTDDDDLLDGLFVEDMVAPSSLEDFYSS